MLPAIFSVTSGWGRGMSLGDGMSPKPDAEEQFSRRECADPATDVLGAAMRASKAAPFEFHGFASFFEEGLGNSHAAGQTLHHGVFSKSSRNDRPIILFQSPRYFRITAVISKYPARSRGFEK